MITEQKEPNHLSKKDFTETNNLFNKIPPGADITLDRSVITFYGVCQIEKIDKSTKRSYLNKKFSLNSGDVLMNIRTSYSDSYLQFTNKDGEYTPIKGVSYNADDKKYSSGITSEYYLEDQLKSYKRPANVFGEEALGHIEEKLAALNSKPTQNISFDRKATEFFDQIPKGDSQELKTEQGFNIEAHKMKNEKILVEVSDDRGQLMDGYGIKKSDKGYMIESAFNNVKNYDTKNNNLYLKELNQDLNMAIDQQKKRIKKQVKSKGISI